ncbi:unnamed protein product [Parnassius mnemosyne]|uniref:Glucose-1-phosphatase n=1 Tax=Parnassius mnemosyne TaxID=213953 RepID=A0AAV1LBN5_9NEOP
MARKLIFIFLIFLTILSVDVNCFKLQQVLILSRHNLRTPLTSNLKDTSPHKWPKWKYDYGYLTDKGALLESYMGEYFKEWLNEQGLLPPVCPTADDVFVYANTKQRTRESANAFVRGAFKSCNISAYSINSEKMDPVFNPILRDTSEETKRKIIAELENKLRELDLDEAYTHLSEILDLKNSHICKNDLLCDFSQFKNEIVYVIGQEPRIVGPLNTTNNVMDAIIMSYYEGMANEDVAWGKINKAQQWTLLTKIIRENQNVRFNSSTLGRNVAKPLLKYIQGVFTDIPPRKVTVLFGHDSNLNSVMAALGLKHYELPNHYEATPPGGKIVFQKWHDEKMNRDLLKINYVYQTIDQIRNTYYLSSKNPPFWVDLELTNCSVDKNGFCPWEKFQKMLISIN